MLMLSGTALSLRTNQERCLLCTAEGLRLAWKWMLYE